MKKIYKRILSLGLAVGVIFSLQESVHICAQENTQTTESIFADYGDENGGETDTAEQITGTGAEENTEQTGCYDRTCSCIRIGSRSCFSGCEYGVIDILWCR